MTSSNVFLILVTINVVRIFMSFTNYDW